MQMQQMERQIIMVDLPSIFPKILLTALAQPSLVGFVVVVESNGGRGRQAAGKEK
jgi:hypothetical protein